LDGVWLVPTGFGAGIEVVQKVATIVEEWLIRKVVDMDCISNVWHVEITGVIKLI
jgi:hypothetical protein